VSSVSGALGRFWPSGWAGYSLLALLLVGVALRLVAVISWWPATTTLIDAWPYATYAESNPFGNPQHPAGYSLILATLGALSREVAFTIAIQHLAGIAAALLLFTAVRRLTGSAGAALLPAGAILLNPDLIYLEHSIMSESWFVLACAGAVYAAIRAFDEPDPWYGWPLLAGLLAALGTVIRSSGIFLIGVIVLALLVCRRRPWVHWRAPLAAAAAGAAVLLCFATLNAVLGDRFGIGPSPGWLLYGRVAQFADCSRFVVPEGSKFLCETTPAEERPGANYYLFDPKAPAPRTLDEFGAEDDLLREWSQRAIRAQPGDYLETVWEELRGYYVPSSRPEQEASGGGIDPQLDFTRGFNLADPYYTAIQPQTERGMEKFYSDFSVDQDPPGLRFLRGWQEVTRFGGVALSIATLLALIGLLIGPRRSRVGVMLLGAGGLSLLIAPALAGNYVGRYTVPMAGLMAAAAAASIAALAAGERARRRAETPIAPSQ
jgi:Dolichyl-phosphate-mannose-protein mannosyltransferase